MKYKITLIVKKTDQVYYHTCEKPTTGAEMSEIIYLLDQIDFLIILSDIRDIRTDISGINIRREEGMYIFDIFVPGERLHVTAKEVEQ